MMDRNQSASTTSLVMPQLATRGRLRSAVTMMFVIVALVVVAVGLWLGLDRLFIDRSPIVVGILHSQTGAMAVSENSMIEAEILALEEINAAGGLLGREIQWVIADGASDWPTIAVDDSWSSLSRAAAVFAGRTQVPHVRCG